MSKTIELRTQVSDTSKAEIYEVVTAVTILETEHYMSTAIERKHVSGNTSLPVHSQVDHPPQEEGWEWKAKSFIDEAIDKHNEWLALYMKGVISAR